MIVLSVINRWWQSLEGRASHCVSTIIIPGHEYYWGKLCVQYIGFSYCNYGNLIVHGCIRSGKWCRIYVFFYRAKLVWCDYYVAVSCCWPILWKMSNVERKILSFRTKESWNRLMLNCEPRCCNKREIVEQSFILKHVVIVLNSCGYIVDQHN